MGKRTRAARAAADVVQEKQKPRRSTAEQRQAKYAAIDQQMEAMSQKHRYSQPIITKLNSNNNNKRQRLQQQVLHEAEESRDEIDEFLYQRDKIALDAYRDNMNHGQEEEEQEQEEEQDSSNTTYIDLPNELDENDNEYDDDEDDSALPPPAPIPLPSIDSDDDAALSADAADAITSSWGRNKSLYYNADTVQNFELADEEGLALAEEEEAEAKRLQKAALKSIQEQEYSIADMLQIITEPDNKKTAEDKKQKKDMTKSLADDVFTAFDLDDLLEDTQYFLASSHHKKKTVEIEEIQAEQALPLTDVTDAAANAGATTSAILLTDADKLKLLLSQSPELLALVTEFQQHLQTLTNIIAPIKESLSTISKSTLLPLQQEQPFMSYINTYHLVLSLYCQIACFYLLMRASGKNVREHVINQSLLNTRNDLNRIIKLQPAYQQQMDEILHTLKPTDKAATMNGQKQNGVREKNGKKRLQNGSRENNQRIQRLSGQEHGHDDEGEEEEEAEHIDVSNDDDDDDMEDAEEAVNVSKGASDDIFKSLPPRSNAKNIVSVILPVSSSLQSLDDLDDINTAALTRLTQQHLPPKKAQAKATIVPITSTTKQTHDDNDEDNDLRHEEDDEDADALHDSAAAAYYNSLKAERAKKLSSRAAAHQPVPIYVAPVLSDTTSVAKRAINRQIQKNEGLKPNRPRDRKTPKTRNRARYEKALIKRKSQVREYKGAGGQAISYSGELTGIRSNVTRSVRLRA